MAAYRPARQGVVLHVSKLGDHSDGRSWATAFTTVQAALESIPDEGGGHTVVVRPDTYMEANLWTAHRGAPGSYNQLVGDVEGQLGSGTSGDVVIDSGDPEKGFKSYDWWGTLKAYKQGWSAEHTASTFSAIAWDRWRLSGLYVTGGDGGLMWDCVDRIEPFTVVVEDCVSIGRAFGGGVASCLPRRSEPICFRRCYLYALDWWGDTAAAYVRVENAAMPEEPDVVFEDCTMVSPQCGLKAGNYGFTTSSRVLVRRCRLVALNFSQPHGTPTDGVVQSVEHGRYLHVELEDSLLMGYKLFGSAVAKDSADQIQRTVRGSVQAYVQYQQEVPAGVHRLSHWPTEAFAGIAPPAPVRAASPLVCDGVVRRGLCELTPVVWQDRLCHLECVRPGSGGTREDYYLLLTDAQTGSELARFATGYGLASALVHEGVFHAFASRWEEGRWSDVTAFRSTDLVHWESRVAVRQEEGEHLFNSSACLAPGGFVLAYETDDPTFPAFSVKYARSSDLWTWARLDGVVFGTDRYTACPCLRWAGGYYYQLYLEHRRPRWYFETYVARSPDLRHWELSPANPVLRPSGVEQGINASDPELVEVDGRTWVYYAVGDQLTWMNIERAWADMPMQEFLEGWFRHGGIPDRGTAG